MLCFGKISGGEKVYGKEGGGRSVEKSRRKTFCLKLANHSIGEPFNLSLVSGIENIYASEGYITTFRRKLFVSSTETFRR